MAGKMKKKDKKMKKEVNEKNEEDSGGIVEGFLGGMPILGDFFKELGKTEVFKEKFKEADEQIKENLRKGEKKTWGFEANIAVRPIIDNIAVRPIIDKAREDKQEISLQDDYFYGKKGKKLTLAVKVPKEEVNLEIKYKTLLITSNGFEKKIKLPDYYREVKKKQYTEGILVLELTK